MPVSNSTLLIGFVLFLFGALFTWFAADQYRSQLLKDSHRLVREQALRYLQALVVLTTVFSLGIAGMFFLFVSNMVGQPETGPDAEPTPETAPIPTSGPFDGLPTITPLPTDRPPLPTSTIVAPETDPILSDAQTAIVGGTNGLGVNLRDAPGIESNVIGNIPDGQPVTLTGETAFVDGLDWVSVISPDGDQGWVTELFLVFEP
ncbi:MAG TPA: SH3 domain-containing protein [Anaerolineales bacterium]|nr:SH3 domain-containing protein [Anaerolineales bacterium]